MSSAPKDPKQVLEALSSGATDLPFPREQVEKARALVKSPGHAAAAEVESLPEPLALAVLEAAVRAKAVELPERLAESSKKALQKAGKKALYQLRSLGVAVPEKEPPPASEPAAKAAPEVLSALLSPITGTGERGLIMGRPVRGGVEAVQLIVSDEHGVVHHVAKDISRGLYRTLLREPKEGKAPPAIEISHEEARERLADAVARNLATRTDFPSGLDLTIRHFHVEPKLREANVPAPDAAAERLATQSGQLHEQPEIRAWLPPIESLRALALKADEIATSQLYINEQQRQEQVLRQTEAAADAFFTPEMKKLYGTRLWEMGEFFERSGRAEPAAIAKAEGRRMFHAGAGPAGPFGRRLFEKVLQLSQQVQAGEALPEPGGPESPQTPPGERRSPGGLILP